MNKKKIKDVAGKIFFGALTLIGLWGTIRMFTKKEYTDPLPVNHSEPNYILIKGGDEA